MEAPAPCWSCCRAMDTGGKDGTIEPRLPGDEPRRASRWPPSRSRPRRSWPTTSCGGSSGACRAGRGRRLQSLPLRGRARRAGARAGAEEVWRGRYEEINALRAAVTAAGTTIVKCFLHISYDEQRDACWPASTTPTSTGSSTRATSTSAARWEDYLAAYEDAIAECSTDMAPWYVVPADRKWYRNWAVANLLAETLERDRPAVTRGPIWTWRR